MSRHRKLVIVAGVVVAGLAAGAWRYDRAQGATGPTGPTAQRRAVAVFDFGRVLREAKRLKDGLAAVRADAVKLNQRLTHERQKLREARAQARQLPADSPERQKRESDLDKIEAALGATIALETKTIRKQETDVYYRTYCEASTEVAAYAKTSGIEVVLRISSDTLDAGKLESVLAHVNRPVVWSAAEADITSIIIERMNQRSVAGEQAPQARGGPA
jgi:Skp family chaperone for outer membrane proteins